MAAMAVTSQQTMLTLGPLLPISEPPVTDAIVAGNWDRQFEETSNTRSQRKRRNPEAKKYSRPSEKNGMKDPNGLPSANATMGCAHLWLMASREHARYEIFH